MKKMMKNVAVGLVLIVTILFLFSSPIMASEQESFWVKMNPDRFEPTSKSAAEQCRQAASLPGSRVTSGNCTTLKSMLDEGKCVSGKHVSDGIRFDHMSTYEKGRPVVVGPITKKLGRTDLATVCNVGNDITAYFFVGDPSVSCGNLAFVVEAPEVIEKLVTELPEIRLVPLPQKCRWVEIERKVNSIPGQLFATQPTMLVGCHGGGVLVGGNVYQMPSTSSVSSTYSKVCD